MEGPTKNAQYTSPQQIERIGLAEEVLRDSILTSANNSNVFSVIADETADISGSIGVRFVEHVEHEATIKKST